MTELPSGTVTFFFTDIAGSTLLERELRERYSHVLAEHRRLLREAFARYSGHEVDTQGDSFFVVFPRARDAVAAAVAAQRAFAEHAWPDGRQVCVRIGMHTGEASLDDGRYVGLAVHRGARIAAAGHGGQILVSSSTRDVVEDDLPAGQQLVDLGEQLLKDLPRPERVFQLAVDDLPAAFPPLKTVDEQKLAEAAAEAVGRFRSGRHRLLAAGAGAALIAGAIIAALLVIDGGPSAEAADIAPNSLGLLDPGTGGLEEQIAVERAPTGVAAGDGAVWVTNSNDASVSRVDPSTGTVRQTIPVGSSPSGIALGAGSVWVANHDAGTVSRIDPSTNGVVQTISVGNGPTAVAYGERTVWVANSNDRTLSQLDPITGAERQTTRTDAVGRGVAVGAGSVWVTDESTKTVARVDAKTGEVIDTVSVGNGPSGIAYGEGGVWVANSLDGTVSRIDPTTSSVTATIQVGDGPGAVAVGSGAVWVSVEFGNRVAKIDPAGAEPRVAETLPLGNRPKGISVGEGGVWVAVQLSGQGHRGGRLVVYGSGLDAVDPAVHNTSPTALSLVYDGLVGRRRVGGAEGTQFVPSLAAALPAPADGGQSYTFRLRQGIRYSDGRLVRPVEFRRGLERQVANGAAAGGVIPADEWKVVGATACRKRRCDLSRGVVTGKGTVTFRLTEPNPSFLRLLVDVSPVQRGTPLEVQPAKPVRGTGPYMVESLVPGREARFVRNPQFRVWSQAARPDGYADEIVLRATPAGDAAVDAVVRGRVDVLLGGPPAGRLPELKTRYPSQLHLVPQRATAFVFLNTRTPPFDDLRVRRAVNFAVDRAKVVALHGGADLAEPTCQAIAPSLGGYVPYCPYTTSPDSTGTWKAPYLERAKLLVAASGTRGLKIVVRSWRPYYNAEARYFVALLRRLGYRASLRMFPDIDSYFRALSAPPYPPAGFAGWFGLETPSSPLAHLACDSPVNFANFCDRGFDRRLRRVLRQEAFDPEGAAAAAARLDREAVDKAPWVPLFTPQLADFVSKRVGNYQANPYGGILLDQLWVR